MNTQTEFERTNPRHEKGKKMSDTAQPKLKNKRLSQGDRDALFRHAKKIIEATEDSSELDNAYHVAAEAIRAEVERQYPVKDMKVLFKYKAAHADECINISRGNWDVDQFCYRNGDNAPLRPSVGGCRRHVYAMEQPAIDAFDTYQMAVKARDGRVKARLADYSALIYHVPSFNDVASVWAEANDLREAIVGSNSAVLVLSNDVIERIQSDAAARLAA
jgi:hypothetical protein